MVIDDILKYARMNKELAHDDEDDPISVAADMKRLVQAQAAELESLKRQVRGKCVHVCVCLNI